MHYNFSAYYRIGNYWIIFSLDEVEYYVCRREVMNFNYNIIVNTNDNKELVVKRCVSVLAFEVRKNIYYMILITSWFKNIIMGEWVTASTKVRREILEKAKEYNINISEVLRKALEEEVKKKEEKNARIIGLSI
jgi:hypothetical protein